MGSSRVVKVGLGHGAWTTVVTTDEPTAKFWETQRGQRGTVIQVLICKALNFLGSPSVLVAVPHANSYTETNRSSWQGGAFFKGIEGVGEVVGARDKEHGALRLVKVIGRITEVMPAMALIMAHGRKDLQPNLGAVVLEKATAVDGDGTGEAWVDSGGNTGDIATPADTGDPDGIFVDTILLRQDEVCADCGRYGVVGPQVFPGEVCGKYGGVVMDGASVDEALTITTSTAQVHGDGGVPAIHPQFHPIFEGFSAPTVDTDHSRNLVALIYFGDAKVGKDFRRNSVERFPFIENGLDGFFFCEDPVSGIFIEDPQVPWIH